MVAYIKVALAFIKSPLLVQVVMEVMFHPKLVLVMGILYGKGLC